MKTIVITGASEGIGRKLAFRLASKNVNLVLGSRSLDKLESICEKLKHRCNSCLALKLDLAEDKTIINFFKTVKKKYKTVDVLVNNAGIGYYSQVKDLDMKKSRYLFEVNFFGLVLCTRECLKLMKKDSKILNVTSEVSYRGMPVMSIYCASKAAVKSFSESLRVEVKDRGIEVLIIYPGYISTDFHKTTNEISNLKRPIYKGSSPEDLAIYMERMIKHNKKEGLPFFEGKVLRLLAALAPWALDYIFHKKHKKELNS